MTPTFFDTPAAFRSWLKRHHRTATELWVGFRRKATGKPSITWPESVEEALCFGWIDGIRKKVDDESYVIRFTPRKPGSIWSNVNTKKANELIAGGRMQPAGLEAFRLRDEKKSGVYSFEQRQAASFTPAQEKRFRADREAWKFFQAQPPGYRRLMTFWVTSAKREETQSRRIETLIKESAAGRRILPMGPAPKRNERRKP